MLVRFFKSFPRATSPDFFPSLPIGVGCVCSTYISGRVLDRQFRATKARILRQQQQDALDHEAQSSSEKEADGGVLTAADDSDLSAFPLERARMRALPVYLFVFWSSICAYGWLVHFRVHLAAPLVFQFLSTYMFSDSFPMAI